MARHWPSGRSRKITMDPFPGMGHYVRVAAERVDDTMSAGFRVGWLEGSDGEVKFDLTAGAGCGSPWLLLTVEVPTESGKPDRRHEAIDMREFVKAWVEHVVAADASRAWFEAQFPAGTRVEYRMEPDMDSPIRAGVVDHTSVFGVTIRLDDAPTVNLMVDADDVAGRVRKLLTSTADGGDDGGEGTGEHHEE